MSADQRPDLRVAVTVAVLGGAVFAVLAAVLVPWHWLPGGSVHPVAADTVFTSQQIARAERISWSLRLAGWGSLAVALAIGTVLGLTRAGSRLVGRIPGPWWLASFLGAGAVLGVTLVGQLPLVLRIRQVRLDAGLSGQPLTGWISDQLIAGLVSWAFTGVGVVVLIGLARRFPRRWPAAAALAAAGLVMLGSFVYPVLIEPLSNDFTALPAGPLRSEIYAVASSEGVHLDDVLVADASRRTTTLNAYVSGFGSTRRVVVYDTVLSALDRAQIVTIVAHELAHAKHRDVLLGTVLGAAGTACGVGLLGAVFCSRRIRDRAGARDAGDVRAVPLILALASIAAFAVSPVENGISRAIEARADRTSLEVTRDPATFVAMQRQLTLRSAADPSPPWLSQFWFGSHPTVLQRIGMARAYTPRAPGE